MFGPPGEKYLLKSVEDTIKYLLEFPEAYYLLNFQSYEILKFYSLMAPYLVTSMSQFAQ